MISNPNIIYHVQEEIKANISRRKIQKKFEIGGSLYEKLKKNENIAMKEKKH